MKRLRLRKSTLPLRLWLVIAVVAVAGAGFLAQLTMSVVLGAWEQQAAAAQLSSVQHIIGTDAADWSDPAWQQQAARALSDLGVETAIFQPQPGASGVVGPLLFATAGARQLWDTSSTSVPSQSPSTLPGQPSFQRVVINGPPGTTPLGIALLWYTRPLDGGVVDALWPLVELGTFAVTLAIVVWLIGQPVLRPLAAMSLAAEDIAGGELHVELPPSPVSEIAAVESALDGMSTALRESLARQSALEHERRLFVGAIAHDLRTPLFMLRGYLKGLESAVAATPEKMAHYVAICQTQAEALERMVSDLFAYTRLEHLELAPDRQPLALGALLLQSIEAVTPQAWDKRITLTSELTASRDTIEGDSHLLTRAVENLLENAVRHTPEDGQICVRTARKGERLIVTVADSGPGIAAEDLPHLFTPLYRGEASRNRQTSGAGLGLAIARRIVQAHGGTLTAANRADGGAIFTASIPAAHEPVSASAIHA
jgi:signal transduction histidine kinase